MYLLTSTLYLVVHGLARSLWCSTSLLHVVVVQPSSAKTFSIVNGLWGHTSQDQWRKKETNIMLQQLVVEIVLWKKLKKDAYFIVSLRPRCLLNKLSILFSNGQFHNPHPHLKLNHILYNKKPVHVLKFIQIFSYLIFKYLKILISSFFAVFYHPLFFKISNLKNPFPFKGSEGTIISHTKGFS